MSEIFTVPTEVAQDLIMPTCTGMGYRIEKHTHNGIRPFLVPRSDEPWTHGQETWFAVKRESDGQIFVAVLPDTDAHPKADDEGYYITIFGEVRRYDDNLEDWVIEEPVTEVEFFAASLHYRATGGDLDFSRSFDEDAIYVRL